MLQVDCWLATWQSVFSSLLCKVLQKQINSNCKISSRKNLGLISSPRHMFVIKYAVNFLSTQISWETFILNLLTSSHFSWLSSYPDFAELSTTILSNTVWRDNVGNMKRLPQHVHLTLKTRQEELLPQPTEIVLVPQKERLGRELQYHFYSINIAQNSLVCSNRSGREQKAARKTHTLCMSL